MPYLRKRDTGAVTDNLPSDGVAYQQLKAMRFQTATTAEIPTGEGGLISGETGGALKVGTPVWEEVSEQDANFPDPDGGRVLVVVLGPAATGADETTQVP